LCGGLLPYPQQKINKFLYLFSFFNRADRFQESIYEGCAIEAIFRSEYFRLFLKVIKNPALPLSTDTECRVYKDSVQQVQGVASVIHEQNSYLRDEGQAKQSAGSGR